MPTIPKNTSERVAYPVAIPIPVRRTREVTITNMPWSDLPRGESGVNETGSVSEAPFDSEDFIVAVEQGVIGIFR